MAISPKNTYNANQIDSSDPTNYPEGKAKNISGVGNTDGTPWEAGLCNDIFGFQQAILAETQETPTNTPETAANSQYLEGLKKIVGFRFYADTAGTGVFTIPNWVTEQHTMRIQIVGGGGGGGGSLFFTTQQSSPGGTALYSGGGAGGGSGLWRELIISGAELARRKNLTINYSIGAGGAGGESVSLAAPGAATGNKGLTGQPTSLVFEQPDSSFKLQSFSAPGGEGGEGMSIGGGPPGNASSWILPRGGRGFCAGGGGVTPGSLPGQAQPKPAFSVCKNGANVGLNSPSQYITEEVPSNRLGLGLDGGRELIVAPGLENFAAVSQIQVLADQKYLWFGVDSGQGNAGSGVTGVLSSGGGGGGPGPAVYFWSDNPAFVAGAGGGDSTFGTLGGQGGAGPGGGGGGAGGDADETGASAPFFGGDGKAGLVFIEITL